jgi:predicted double-glycine peptidase
MVLGNPVRWVALAALASAVGCGRCGASSGQSSGAAPATSVEGSAAPSAGTPGQAAPALPGAELPVADVPEVRDTGTGRATAALRAVLQAYGIAFDAATLERECKVDDDGASVDDLEDVAVKYGLEAGSVIAPAEHVLLPEAKMLPAIVIVDTADDEEEFVVAWRLDGDRVQVMDPREGRRWMDRAELQKQLYVHEMVMPAEEYQAAMAAPSFGDALRARMTALGGDAAAGQALFGKAAAVGGTRGLGALDAAIRLLAVGTPGPETAALLPAAYACALEGHCEGVTPIAPKMWSVQPAPNGADGEAQVKVRGAVLLAIAGRAKPAEPGEGAPAKPEGDP